MYDVIIAGSGPGGASTAYFLSQAGMRVLVIEKEKLPRYKACGGGVSPRMLAKYFPFSFEPVIEVHAGLIHYWYQGLDTEIPLQGGSLAFVMREKFDAFLLDHSQADVVDGAGITGVVEREDCVIVETGAGRQFEARYLVGADGANSSVAKLLNLRRRQQVVAAIEAEVCVPEHLQRKFSGSPTFILSGAGMGYQWIFPKGNHLSVGIGMLHPRPGQMKPKLFKMMAKFGINLEGTQLHGHTIPMDAGFKPRSGKRTLLVGDAAGLADPLSGEGIRLAIKSGKIASESILSGDIQGYSQRIFQSIGRSQMLARPLMGLFFTLPALCYLFGACNPLASQAFMDLLADRAGYAEVWLRIFGSLPLFLGAEFLSLALPKREDAIRKSVYEV
jgi:geranylgeranyl reductase family protein